MLELIQSLNAHSTWDYVLKSYDGWGLSISGGTAPEYALPLVTFAGVTYLSCPTEFSHPKFRLGTKAERESVGKIVPLDHNDFLVAIEAETMAGLGSQIFFIVAESGVLHTNV